MKYYAGIGSRETPTDVLALMKRCAEKLAGEGWTLRSGGAKGADSAFESGAGLAKEIFYARDATVEARRLAEKHHPAWNRCSEYAQRLHARNCFQVLGADLRTPSKFVICWTKDAAGGGGTGQALRIAMANDIPIFDLADAGVRRLIEKWFVKC